MFSIKIKSFLYGALISISFISVITYASWPDGVFGDYFKRIINDVSGSICENTNTVITDFDETPGNTYGTKVCRTIKDLMSSAGIWSDVGGNIGIGTNIPSAKLDVNGNIKFWDSWIACSNSIEWQQRYNFTSKKMEYCDGINWITSTVTNSVKFHQTAILIPFGTVNLDDYLPAWYIAAFMTSCWPASYMDSMQVAYYSAGGQATCGAIMAQPWVHSFAGASWFAISWYLEDTWVSAVTNNWLGYGQTWQDMTASRVLWTTYTNSTWKPISVHIIGWNPINWASSASLIIDGVAVDYYTTSAYNGTLKWIVPPWSTYKVTGSSWIFSFWAPYWWKELR